MLLPLNLQRTTVLQSLATGSEPGIGEQLDGVKHEVLNLA